MRNLLPVRLRQRTRARTAFSSSLALILVVGAAGAANLRAQPAPRAQAATQRQAAVERLTGGRSKVWIFEREEGFMGDDRCTKGLTIRFSADGTARRRQCVAGRVHTSEVRWSISPTGATTMQLVVGGQSFQLLFAQPKGGVDKMTLRRPVPGKAGVTIDSVFQFERG